MYSNFYVNKSTDTIADLLLLYGFTNLLVNLAPTDSQFNPTIEDRGSLYLVTPNYAVPSEWIEGRSHFNLNPFIQTSSKTATPAPADMAEVAVINYDQHKTRRDEFWAAFDQLAKADRSRDRALLALQEQGVEPPDHRYPIWALINQQKAIKSYNSMVMTWNAHQNEAFPALLRLILDLFASPMNDVEAAADIWIELAKMYHIEGDLAETAPQITNPGMGKGSSYSKATRVSEGNLNGFWLLEYLRFAGLYAAGLALTVQGEKDRKLYIPVPCQMQWSTFGKAFPQYRETMLASTAVKLDVLAALRYMQVYLNGWLDAQQQGLEWDEPQPGDHVRAISTIFLKDMGSSHAVMRMNELPLPRWVKNVQTPNDALHYLEILAEHQRNVMSLDEKHGDEYALLRTYRQFLTSSDLNSLLEFLRGYAHLTMSRMNKGDYAPWFSVTFLEEILMTQHSHRLTPILENDGFRAIAEAIRRSTVIPQYQKSQKRENSYEIRYGLGDKLIRAALDRNRFIIELTNFMHSYNRETARLAETRNMQFRKAITTQDIDAITDLIDTYGDVELIAGLLVAYGYARDPKIGENKEEGEN